MLLGVLAAAGLVLYGKLRFPETSVLSLLGAFIVLGLYGLAGWLSPQILSRQPKPVSQVIKRAGLLGGGIFLSEIALEYIVLPANNTWFGIVEFGSVFAVYFMVGVLLAYQRAPFGAGVVTGVGTAMTSSLLWYIAILVSFYLFLGTERQQQVFRAEGNYVDFQRSGMRDFNTFIMEDFLGAGFFHLLLGPLLAAVLASIGGLAGRGLRRLRDVASGK